MTLLMFQIVATKIEEGEQLSLEDLNGIFFTVPVSKTGFRAYHQF